MRKGQKGREREHADKEGVDGQKEERMINKKQQYSFNNRTADCHTSSNLTKNTLHMEDLCTTAEMKSSQFVEPDKHLYEQIITSRIHG